MSVKCMAFSDENWKASFRIDPEIIRASIADRNLVNALTDLVRKKKTIDFWADAISIDRPTTKREDIRSD